MSGPGQSAPRYAAQDGRLLPGTIPPLPRLWGGRWRVEVWSTVPNLRQKCTEHFGSAVHMLAFAPLGGSEEREAWQGRHISVYRLMLARAVAPRTRACCMMVCRSLCLMCIYPGGPLRPRACLLYPLLRLISRCLAKAMATCRRKMIAEALGEQGGKGLCNGGCDVCSGCAGAATNIDATRHATTLVRCAWMPPLLRSSI